MTDSGPSPPQQGSEPRPLALRFHGSASDYFRLWIVNLCLTLITCGIFSAWSKVRKKRFFYAHTTLDGTPFQYLGQPLPILKGRLLAAILFGAYYVARNFVAAALPFVVTAICLLAPWAIVRSAAFTARYSAFRNLTLAFDGGYLGALANLWPWALLPVSFYLGVEADPLYFALMFYAFVLVLPATFWHFKHFVLRHTRFGGQRARFSATSSQFYLALLFTPLLYALTISLAWLVLFGITHGLGLLPRLDERVRLWGFVALSYAGYVFAYGGLQATISNVIWNHTRLGPLEFRSTLSGPRLTWLYLSNVVAVAFSLGLLSAWAVVRTFRYRIEHMEVNVHGDLGAFQATGASAVQAAGSEVSELFGFDLDFSL